MAVSKTNVDGPFSYHVYIGCGFKDASTIAKLAKKLISKNVLCFPRYEKTRLNDRVRSSIVDGIKNSRKCLIFVTDHYKHDDQYEFEVGKVLEKADRLSRDAVVVLTDKNINFLPEHFRKFTCEEVTKPKMEEAIFIQNLADKLLEEINPELATLSKINIGYGSALGYFYGFLRLVLPEFGERLKKQALGGNDEAAKMAVKKMMIILPESCFCPPRMTEAGKIEHTDKFVVRSANRAGNELRDYKSSLYKIFDDEQKKFYYFVGELATPLLTMFESYYFNIAGMTRDELYAERDAFYITLKGILSHPDNKACHDEFKLLFWPSDPAINHGSSNPVEVLPLYEFLLPVVKHELELEATLAGFSSLQSDGPSCNSDDDSMQTDNDSLHFKEQSNDHDAAPKKPLDTLETFTVVDVPGNNPRAAYDKRMFKSYKMDSERRGICLIINIKKFEKHAERRGSEHDVENVEELFKRLRFDVKTHEDLTMPTLEKLLLTTMKTDHTNYDAFACVFMTHGQLGELFTSDGEKIRILDIAEYFCEKNCPSLSGKPKMFFIQACQRGTEPGEQQPASAQTCTEYADVDAGDSLFTVDASTAPVLLTSSHQQRSTFVPSYPDFVMSYATLPGCAAYRDTTSGTLYIKELRKHLPQSSEINEALRLVTKGVVEHLKDHGATGAIPLSQRPFYLTSGIDKLICLLS